MKKIIPILAGLVLAFLVGREVILGMASEETRIRRLLQDEVDAFNDASVSGCMAGFAPEYQDLTSRLDRTSLQRALLYTFQKHREYRIAAPGELLDVRMRNDAETEAQVDLRVVLSDGDAPLWAIRVQAELSRGDHGWRFVSSRYETMEGARPGG